MLRWADMNCIQTWICPKCSWRVHVCVSKNESVSCKSKDPPGGLLYIARGTAGVILVWLGGVVHLPNDFCKQFVYHGFAFGRGLHEGAAPLLRQGLAFAGRHLPLAFQVHLVSHQNHRDLLIPEDADTLNELQLMRCSRTISLFSHLLRWSRCVHRPRTKDYLTAAV